MQKTKKLITLLLASVLLFSFSMTVSAAPQLVTVMTDFSDPSIPVSVPVLSYSGTGDSVVQNIALPDGFSYKVSATHDGGSNFIVKFLNDTKTDYLFNEIGEYAGTVILEKGSVGARENCLLEVKADGNWSLTISTVTNSTTRSMVGSGDKVTGLFTLTNPTNVFTIQNDGSSNFIVICRFSDGSADYLVNEIGAYSGQVVVRSRNGCYSYLEIISDGSWSIDCGYGEVATTIADIN